MPKELGFKDEAAAILHQTDPPFGRKPGETPAISPADERDITAFLKTLTDGSQPRRGDDG